MGWDRGESAAAIVPPLDVNIVSSVPIDISDRVGRLLGVISGAVTIGGQPISVDVIDRVGRLLGVVASITNPVTVTGAVDATIDADSRLSNGATELLTHDPDLIDALSTIALLLEEGNENGIID